MRVVAGSQKHLAGFACSTALLLLVSLLAGTPGYAHEKLKVGDIPPQRLGWSTKLSDYRGKVVVISFWATWCPPCRKEMAMLDQLARSARPGRLVVLAVNWRQNGDVFEAVRHALRGTALTLLSDQNGVIGSEYDVDAIPHMVIVGRDGRIAAIHIGYAESEIPALIQEINTLGAQPDNAPAPQHASN